MPREVLRIQATKRVVAAEDDFFISGNFERYKAFFQHAQKRAMHPTSNDRMDDEYDMQSISTNHIVCVEVGCNQMFSSLKKVRLFMENDCTFLIEVTSSFTCYPLSV